MTYKVFFQEGYRKFRGGFWNYFSMGENFYHFKTNLNNFTVYRFLIVILTVCFLFAGMDAQVSYAFHAERKLHPEKFKNQSANQSAYAKLTCSQGWFWASLSQPSSW